MPMGQAVTKSLEVATGAAIGGPQWIALYVHALDVVPRLGLDISLNVTNRWDLGITRGSTVTPEDAMQLLTFSRSHVEGGGRSNRKGCPCL